MTETFLDVQAVTKSFGAQKVLSGVDLTVRQGEFLTLLGPSGCGKTTLLRIIGGFERADSGAVRLDGKDLGRTAPEHRPFNTVFQSYALFPHMTVWENVAYGLRATGVGRSDVRHRVDEMLELVHLAPLGRRNARELSGGQQQRVALARALVNEPQVLLLDEPLGALDLQLRRALQDELRGIQRRLGTTFIYVTHDQEEALALSHRIALMEGGNVAQWGTPEEVYDRPTSRFVAEFVGDTNLIPATVKGVELERAMVRLPGGADLDLYYDGEAPLTAGAEALAVIRPEHLVLSAAGDGDLRGRLDSSVFMGTHTRHEVVLDDGTPMRVNAPIGDFHHPVGPVHVDVIRGKGVVVPADAEAGRGEAS